VIFTTLKRTYGTTTIRTARLWETWAHKEASALELHFLLSCKQLNVLPNSINYRSPIKSKLAIRTAAENGKRMLNTLITETHNRIRNYRLQINKNKQSISSTVTEQETNSLDEAITHTTCYRVQAETTY
jgi:phosphoribosyl-dephospho-CoA transferase